MLALGVVALNAAALLFVVLNSRCTTIVRVWLPFFHLHFFVARRRFFRGYFIEIVSFVEQVGRFFKELRAVSSSSQWILNLDELTCSAAISLLHSTGKSSSRAFPTLPAPLQFSNAVEVRGCERK